MVRALLLFFALMFYLYCLLISLSLSLSEGDMGFAGFPSMLSR